MTDATEKETAEFCEREKIERKCAKIYGLSLEEMRRRIYSFVFSSELLKKQEKLIEEYVREIHLLRQGDYEEATNEAFDLGFSVALHDIHGLSWDEAEEKLKEIREKYKKGANGDTESQGNQL